MNQKTTKILALAIYASFVFTLIGYYSFGHETKIYASNISKNESVALAETNKIRKEKGVATLSWNSKLANAAQDKARDMVDDNYFDHTSPSGKKAWNFVLGENYEYKAAGENLAIDFDSVKDATVAWKESPTHYSNIISPKYTDFGFAELNGVINGKSTTVYVQIFGSEMSIYEQALVSSKGGSNVN